MRLFRSLKHDSHPMHAKRSGVTLSLPALLLGLVGCTASEAAGDSPECLRYKGALLQHAECDPAFAPPPVDENYDAYRCVGEDEFVAQDDLTSLNACTDYLEELAGPVGKCVVPLGNAERLKCKTALVLTDHTARLSNEGVGSECVPSFTPPSDVDSALIAFVDECSTGACLLEPGDAQEAYCTCSCDAGDADLPTCECPQGFSCGSDVRVGDGPGVGKGYCVRM